MRSSVIRLVAFVAVLFSAKAVASEDLSQVPNFADSETWIFVEERPLVYAALGQEIGTIKKYRHVTNRLLVGFEEFIRGHDKPFWKRWGSESTSRMYHALRKKDGEGWIVGPPGSYWHSVGVIDGLALKGVWFFLFIPAQEEAYGRYFALPGSAPKEAPKKGSGI
ncbi:MAG TPA: hypothetical protein VNL14_20895 [Candidatus Acidoferrales bacterium]|nr:hypothetical protein [Candidatus Acidoferrales bacterium]